MDGWTVEKGDTGEEQATGADCRPEGITDDIPTDRTCAQCRGEIDGTERLVSVSGRAVWLHDVCQRFWLRAHGAGES